MGLIKGLHFLSQHFQVIIFNNYTSDPTDPTHKDGADRVKKLLTQYNISVDAIYSTNLSKVQGGGDKFVAEDFSQIFLDFNLTTVKKVSEKVLFVTSLEMDNIGMLETIHVDPKGFFLFDMS